MQRDVPLTAKVIAAGIWLKFIEVVEAHLPFNSTIASPELKTPGQSVTFDPLGVAAILHNPRADASAARLYAQRNGDVFRWPHTMQLGAVLTPVKLLVDHLVSGYSTVHPASTMCQTDGEKLSVRSDMVFKELTINFSNMWMEDILAYKSKKLDRKDAVVGADGKKKERVVAPANDIIVCHVPDMYPEKDRQSRLRTKTFTEPPPAEGDSKLQKAKIIEPPKELVRDPEDARTPKFGERFILDVIGILTGLSLATCTVFSVLTGDIWAVTLFFLFFMHWVVSAIISVTSLIKYRMPPIKKDGERKYALFERPGGAGTVVFTGRKDNLERWGRIVWEFDDSHENVLKNTILHWSWVISGSLSAVASVACMVNMGGPMQLAFLGVIVYSSIAEILATRVARNLQRRSLPEGAYVRHVVEGSETRSKGICRAALTGPEPCRLANFDEKSQTWQALDWTSEDIKLLPDLPEFVEMSKLLKDLAALRTGQDAEVQQAINEYLNHTYDAPKLAERVAKEAKDAWDERNREDAKRAGNTLPSKTEEHA